MRKSILLIALFVLFLFPCFSQEWVISTSQGDKTLIVPEGMTLEEAYQTMAQLYWEERYDREELQATVEDLTASAQTYIDSIEALQSAEKALRDDYDSLLALYKEKTKTPWIEGLLGADMGYNLDGSLTAGLWGGVLIKERVLAEAGFRYPLGLTFKLGVVI